MKRGLTRLGIVYTIAVIAAAQAAAAESTPDDLEFFERDVRPLLVEHCSECHSGPAAEAEGGLSFDTRGEFLAAEGVAVAGQPEASLLVEVVHYTSDLQMPPEGKLPDEAIATLEAWVRRGLPWPDDGSQASAGSFDLAARKAAHWCWQPPQAASPPEVAAAEWCRSDIDQFVLARLEAAGLSPAAEASRRQLVRRAAEVLTGLPPDPADLERIAADASHHAFDRYVDELLASPHYGERFARHWLDVVRYVETRGHEFDYPIPNAWQYRDWVVRAFNANLPLDDFITWQLAGDLLPEPTLEQQVATGFVRLNPTTSEGGAIPDEFQAKNSFDRTETLGTVLLGMTLTCARCHTHKYDPVTHTEYYELLAFFNSTAEPPMDRNAYAFGPTVLVPADHAAWQAWQELEAETVEQVAHARNLVEAGVVSLTGDDASRWSELSGLDVLALAARPTGPFAHQQLATEARDLLVRREAAEAAFTTTLVAADLSTPRETRVLHRG